MAGESSTTQGRVTRATSRAATEVPATEEAFDQTAGTITVASPNPPENAEDEVDEATEAAAEDERYVLESTEDEDEPTATPVLEDEEEQRLAAQLVAARRKNRLRRLIARET
ncbi:hypothetical protein SPI_06856 [Niveomyces insectorum RCEF 264]|uniref:Uncharacterized protein n=1 Tax=Niveomyces insectorum RCEF 264 TaxID=1081102 RepID=A0A167QUA0_9HYPO|nr:hypothetical protein SPI_06856 [Niveomyces insectorum RCEF 264]